MSRERGFTIIEVILFLAISGLLFAVAFAYMNNSIKSSRFSTSVNITESFIQRQYSRVQSNSTPKQNGTGGISCQGASFGLEASGILGQGNSGSCVLLGELLFFISNTQVEVYPIVGWGGAGDLTTAKPHAFIGRNSKTPSEIFISPWSSTLIMHYSKANVETTFNALAIIRDVKTESINLYYQENMPVPSASGGFSVVDISSQFKNRSALLCINSADHETLVGRIQFKSEASNNYSLSNITSAIMEPNNLFEGNINCA